LRKESKERSTSIAEARKKNVLKLLKELGSLIYDELDQGRFPSVTLKSRSVRNIVYDSTLQQFVLGHATVKRSASNIKHIRPFTQLIWLAYFAKKLVEGKKTSTLRDVYYSAQAFNVEFVDQAESDELITDLEVLLGTAREDFNVYPEERSAIFGNMTIEYTVPGYEGRRLDLSSHPDGVMIGPALTTAEFVDTDAEIVLAIEKGGLFTRFVEERVHERFKAILVNTAGQPPRSTRYLLRRLNQELGLPVGILCDADPWGAHIAMVIKSGSVQRNETIIVRDNRGKIREKRIGEFVDECISQYGFSLDKDGNEFCYAVPYEVMTIDERYKAAFKPISAAIRHKHKGILYRVETESGKSVSVTPNHSIFVLRHGRVVSVPTSEIKEGDFAVVQSCLQLNIAGNYEKILSEREQSVFSTSCLDDTTTMAQLSFSKDMPRILALNMQNSRYWNTFPVLAGGLDKVSCELEEHAAHSRECMLVLRSILHSREGGEGVSVERDILNNALTHLLMCSRKASTILKELTYLSNGDIAFERILSIEKLEFKDEYVYDISVPFVERFLGGGSGILLHNSANAAHLRELTTPSAVWLGVYASDIIKYKLPSDKLTEIDIKRLYELKADPRYKEKMWHDELDTFLKIKKKSEQEAFARYGLSYIVDKYLPEKLELLKS
jgi:DNA topoisomerase-6 subunit A